MIRVLMVCKGNICRSPMAEAILIDKLKQMRLRSRIKVCSAGTHNYHIGEQHDHRALKTLKQHDIQFKGQARQFSRADFEQFDWILVADSENLQALTDKFGYDSATHPHVQLMTSFSSEFKNKPVPDPYYGEMDDFEQVYELLEESIKAFISYIEPSISRGEHD